MAGRLSEMKNTKGPRPQEEAPYPRPFPPAGEREKKGSVIFRAKPFPTRSGAFLAAGFISAVLAQGVPTRLVFRVRDGSAFALLGYGEILDFRSNYLSPGGLEAFL